MSTPMRWGAPPPPRGGGGGGAGSYQILGVFVAKPIAWLIGLILFMSAGGSLLQRGGTPLVSYSLLNVDAVWNGEVWRLVTWAPLALDFLSLFFGCLLLYSLGPDLLHRWGVRRFFVNFFATAVLVGALTCIVGRWWQDVGSVRHLGLWPVEDAMIIAWASLFRDRQILAFLVLPIAGRNLITLTIAVTVIMGALYGFGLYVPHFLAELMALAYMDVIPIRSSILRARLAWFQRGYKRRTAHLTRIDRDDPPRWTH